MRETISEGGVLLVSTSQATAGRDVAALVGASILNLVDGVIREQGRLPSDRRRGALVVVDEMQSMPGVDYESMLSELGKFGASFVIAAREAEADKLVEEFREKMAALEEEGETQRESNGASPNAAKPKRKRSRRRGGKPEARAGGDGGT